LIETFANKRAIITVLESLPKEKVGVLGTCEIPLSSFLRNTTSSTLIEANWYPVAYTNTKLLSSTAAPAGITSAAISEGGESNAPEIQVSFTISGPLITAADTENGNFMTIRVESAFPVPDEWTLKDGSEKDLNSSMFLVVCSP
jgi:hypothetical protein